MKIKESYAIFFLFLMTLCWGITFPLVNWAIDVIDAVAFVFLRFSLAFLVLTPLVLPGIIKKMRAKKLPENFFHHSLIMGIIDCIVFLTQTVALEYLNSARCAFIVSSYVVIVPFMAPLFFRERIHSIHLIRAAIALLGMFYLFELKLNQNLFVDVGIGDLLALICALTVALGILYIQKYTEHIHDYLDFAYMQIAFTIPVPFFIVCYQGKLFNTLSSLTNLHQVLIPLIYCSLIATSLLLYLQIRFQRSTTPQTAALIYSFEPVFALIFSYVFFHESIKSETWIGGGIMFLALISPLFFRFISGKRKE